MSIYAKLALTALGPVALSLLLYAADKKTPFGRLDGRIKQAVFGVIFGISAILGTEFGLSVMGATLNVRDAAPICAGLIFGAPAGVIAGVIGGVERFIAAGWGAGEYTKIACSVSTMLAGFFAAWLRKYMFDDKKPAWYYGLATGVIIEVVHMLMVLLTHMNDARNAFAVLQKCALPMIALCGASVTLAVFLVGVVGRERLRQPREKMKISQTFQRRLLTCVLIAFFLTSLFTYVTESGVTQSEMSNLLSVNVSDVKADISDVSDSNLLSVTRQIAKEINYADTLDRPFLEELKLEYDVSEINVIDTSGIITVTTEELFEGFDMSSGEQSAEFMILLSGTKSEYVQEYQGTAYDDSILRKYAGMILGRGGFVQVGYDSERFHRDIDGDVIRAAANRHVGESGSIIVCSENMKIISDRNNSKGKDLSVTGMNLDRDLVAPGEVFESMCYGELSCCMYDVNEGYCIIAVRPASEALLTRDVSVYITIFMEVLVFTALFILVYFLIKRLIVDNIRKINRSLSRITEGDLDETVNVRSNEEFASLSDDINSTVMTLKHYIDEAAARIDKELEFAKTIQASALPRVFPPYPNRSEFAIWAGMKPAKEVGGDFYDFYLIGEDKLAFMIADVSGKGIPAAMFMMTSKTLLKSLAETGIEVNEVFTGANEQLCATNEAGMFITSWMGILDLKTGIVSFANAGHNPPLVRHSDGKFEYLRSRPGFVLAGMEGVMYRPNELQLEPGDMVYLYTDGVTEATNANNELYGEERLLEKLNSLAGSDVETICRSVKADVDEFVGEAPQFDDITMVCLAFNKPMGGDEQ